MRFGVVGNVEFDFVPVDQIGFHGFRFPDVIGSRFERLGQRDASRGVGGESVHHRMIGMPNLLGYRFLVLVEHLKREPFEWDGLTAGGVAFHDLHPRSDKVIVDDVVQRAPVYHLVGPNDPIGAWLIARGRAVGVLVDGISFSVVGDGALDAVDARSLTEPPARARRSSAVVGRDGADGFAGRV